MKKLIIFSFCAFGLGCGGGLDDEESSQAFAATQSVLLQGAANAQSSTNGPADTVNVETTFSCLEGGDAQFKGSFGTENGNTSFKYSVEFNDCVSQGITMSGQMDYDLNFETTGSRSFKSVYKFSGDIDYSGKIEGGCVTDLVATTDINKSGGSFSYVGSICGNDAQNVTGSFSLGR